MVPATRCGTGYGVAADGTYCRRRIALRPEVQARLGLGNVVFRLHHPRITGLHHRAGPPSAIYLAQKFISYDYAKRLVGDSPPTLAAWLRHGWNVVNDSLSAVRFLTCWLRDRIPAESRTAALTLGPQEADIETVMRRDGAYGGHHIGAARMGVNPATGIVDRIGNFFGVNNLFIASSAVFPT